MCCCEQILETAPLKTATVWLLAHHLTNQAMLGTAGESKYKLISNALHMNTPALADQQRLTYIRPVSTLDAVKRTCQE